jgi:glycyl-tRNA synthetase beta chain
MSNILIDIFSEEIPAKMQQDGLAKLTVLFAEAIPHSNITSFISPRHICLSIKDFNSIQTLNIKGPKVDANPEQLQGFMKKYNIAKSEDLTIKDGVYFLERVLSADESQDAIAKNILKTLGAMVWPKSMSWGDYKLHWIRPIHSIACFLDDLPLHIQFGHIKSDTKTYGHRSQNSREIELNSANLNQYLELLNGGGVIIPQQKRKQMILEQITSIITPLKLNLIPDIGLLDEVVGLIEKPKVFIGKIDYKFMSLPHEILISSLKTNQKYLLLNDQLGNLAPYFIIVSDIDPDDEGQAIIKGNELVLNARLNDAQHVIKSDLQVPFESLIDKLHKIQFHKDIGTLYEKVMRIQEIASDICDQLGINATYVRRAAVLCKNDLVTQAVGEFPELQGIVGYYYSKAHGEIEIVSQAIKDHYKPSGPKDSIPSTLEGCIIAIADKLDTLNSLFAVNIKPTSTKDPYALRRAALGIIRIILHHQILIDSIKLNAIPEVVEFIAERAKHLYKSQELDQILVVLKR